MSARINNEYWRECSERAQRTRESEIVCERETERQRDIERERDRERA